MKLLIRMLRVAPLCCLALVVQQLYFIPISFAQTELPTTGQTTCFNAYGGMIACAGTGQDGEIQAGVPWPSPRFTDHGDGTVTDHLTGLMWTKETNQPGITLSWNEALNYVAGMNTGGNPNYGYTDWRLPNAVELQSMISSGNTKPSLPSPNPFLVPACDLYSPSYWSSTSGTGSNSAGAYALLACTGGLEPSQKNDSGTYVWPVRTIGSGLIALPKTGQTLCFDENGTVISCNGTGQDGELQEGVAWPTPRLIDLGNGTVTDNLTGLMWTKNANVASGYVTWQESLNYIASMNSANGGNGTYGFHDWRLPNRLELVSLIDFGNDDPSLPSINPFNNSPTDPYYWTSTTNIANFNSNVDIVHIGSAALFDDDKNLLNYLWAVRGGQTLASRNYTLTLQAEGTGSGSVIGGGSYLSGQTATVSASAIAGSTFTGWTGPNALECATGSVIMNSDKSCTANFTLTTAQIPSRIYVSNHASSGSTTEKIIVINPVTNTETATIPTSGAPGDLTASPDGSTLYAVEGTSLAVISVLGNAPVNILTGVGDMFNLLAVSPDGNRLYLVYRQLNPSTLIIKIFDLTVDKSAPALMATISNPMFDGCYGPLGLAVRPDGSTLYLACRPNSTKLPDRFFFVDTATNVPTQTTTFARDASNYTFINALAVLPTGNKVYLAWTNNAGSTVEVFDGVTGMNTGSIALPANALPRAIAVAPDGSTLYVVDQRLGTHVIDTANETRVLTLPQTKSRGLDIAMTPDGSRLYTALMNDVFVLDSVSTSWLNTVTGDFGGAFQIVVTPGHS
jgi:DNA-binding beta-propeller fold protein YncE